MVVLLAFFLRKEWDSNPRYDKNRTPDFESGPFDHSGIFPYKLINIGGFSKNRGKGSIFLNKLYLFY